MKNIETISMKNKGYAEYLKNFVEELEGLEKLRKKDLECLPKEKITILVAFPDIFIEALRMVSALEGYTLEEYLQKDLEVTIISALESHGFSNLSDIATEYFRGKSDV